MGVNLQKGQKVSLTKDNSNLGVIVVGLGWDPVKPKKGFLGIGGDAPNIDCDASVIMLDEKDKYQELVYFGNKTSKNKSVTHSGDNLTGEGYGDDETILVDLQRIPANVSKLMFTVNIYDCERRKQTFGMINNAYIRILDQKTKEELLKYNITEGFAGKTALIAGEVYKHNDEWKFNPVGEGTLDKSVSEMTVKFK